MSDWFIFSEYFSVGGLISLGRMALLFLKVGYQIDLLSNSKAVNICGIRKGGKLYLF